MINVYMLADLSETPKWRAVKAMRLFQGKGPNWTAEMGRLNAEKTRHSDHNFIWSCNGARCSVRTAAPVRLGSPVAIAWASQARPTLTQQQQSRRWLECPQRPNHLQDDRRGLGEEMAECDARGARQHEKVVRGRP